MAGRIAILIVNGFWPVTTAATTDAVDFPWIELCLREVVRRSSGSEYEIHVWDSTNLNEHLEAIRSFEGVRLWEGEAELGPGVRLSHRDALDALVARLGSDVEYIVFLDSDAMPVADNWLTTMTATVDGGAAAVGVLRDERVPEVPPFIHVSCVCIRREELLASGVTFGGGGAGDEPSLRLTNALMRRGRPIAGMHRTNAVEAHHLLAGMYADVVYHHGSGSRPAWFFGSTDQGADERLRVVLRDAAFADFDHLVAVLRGQEPNDIWAETDSVAAPEGLLPPVDPMMAEHYESGAELGRLENQNALEFLRSKIILEQRLPPEGRIIDVGGGPGVYAEWFAARGYAVDLVDPIPLHVEQARQASERGAAFSAHVGDARCLNFPDSIADAIVMMGPLFHLVEPDDRRQALAEAFRVLRPGGMLAASAMGRFFIFGHAVARGQISDPEVVAGISAMVETGDRPAAWLPFPAHAHRPEELETEVREAGFADVVILAVEGWFHLLGDIAARLEDPVSRDALLALLSRFESDPGLVQSSGHLMAVGRRP